MKKLIAIISFSVISCAAAFAQPRAVGGYLGLVNQGAFYQHSINEKQFVNVSVSNDMANFTGFKTVGLMLGADYEFIFASFPKSKGTFNLMAGPGLYLGHGVATVPMDNDGMAGFVSVSGNIGFDFTFNCHVQLFARLAPKIGVCIGVDYDNSSDPPRKIYTPGLELGRVMYAFVPEFGVAYSF